MLRVVADTKKRYSFLVSSEGEREIRGFLREQGIKPRRSGFSYIVPPPCIRLSCYRLEGDECLKVLALGLPRITFGLLGLYVIQAVTFDRPKYGTLAR